MILSAVSALAVDSSDPALRERLREAMNETESFPDRFDAQVWLTDMSARLGNQVPDPTERVYILKQVHYEAMRTELPPEMVLAVIDIESAFNPYAVSVAGAQGLMQVMPFWLDEIGRPDDRLIDINTNLRMGCTILKYYLDMEKGDWIRALGRYNGSLGSRKYPEKVLNRLRSRWFRQ
ncbi:MAG: lytic transglycosylase domain-containing protein [Gammaproteobacteria bacterium]|nr:lytic transglycosylase domain-containing protein [Gammaproteobacteria bacterium]